MSVRKALRRLILLFEPRDTNPNRVLYLVFRRRRQQLQPMIDDVVNEQNLKVTHVFSLFLNSSHKCHLSVINAVIVIDE